MTFSEYKFNYGFLKNIFESPNLEFEKPDAVSTPKKTKTVRFESSSPHFKSFSMPGLNGVKNEWTNGARRPYVIGVVGGTNSGKTSVCKKIISEVKIIVFFSAIF